MLSTELSHEFGMSYADTETDATEPSHIRDMAFSLTHHPLRTIVITFQLAAKLVYVIATVSPSKS